MKHTLFYIRRDACYAGLKLTRLGILVVCASVLFSAGCKRDLIGNTSYESREFSIVLPRDGGTLIPGLATGDSIKAQIQLPGQAVADFDTTAYSFVWTSFDNNDTLSRKSYLSFRDVGNQNISLISCLLTVTEKSTGIVKQAVTDVLITTATREGWVLLSEQSGAAKLSMLTYTTHGYRKFIDIGTELGIQLPLKGKPHTIEALGSESASIGKYQWLGITTDQEIKFVQTTNMIPDPGISAYLTQTFPPSPSSPVSLDVAGRTTFVGTQNKNISLFANIGYMSFGIYLSNILNSYTPLTPELRMFHASPQHTFISSSEPNSEYGRLLYDEDSCVFVRTEPTGSTDAGGLFPLQLPFSLKGYQLKAITTLKGEGDDEITAFLHNPSSHESYVIQFLSNGNIKVANSIPYTNAEDIVAADFLQIDYNAGYLIYTKGSEVYAYDYQTGQAFSLLDFGNEKISVLKMVKNASPISNVPGRTELYKQLLKSLIVCTYDPAHPDNTGTFRLFSIPLGHQLPVKETEETGFPKIVDATFAPMP